MRAALWARLTRGMSVFWPWALMGAALCGAGVAGYDWVRLTHENHLVRALERSDDVAVSSDASARLLLARAQFLLRMGKPAGAEALASRVAARGTPREAASLHYDLGNFYLRQAFARIGDARFEEATPLVIQAKRHYRAALALEPDDWDGKFNLDVAMRLVRDFPISPQGKGDTLPASKKLWPDLPGQPEGLP